MDKQREMFEEWFESTYVTHNFGYSKLDMFAAWQAEQKAQWQPIETLPVKQMLESREMFVVRGFNVEGIATGPYTTDAYAVWLESDCGCCHKFARWKHNFPPTHWMPLPPEPEE